MAVLDFNKKLAAKKEQEENQKHMNFFKELFANATYQEKQEIKKAIEAADEEQYKKVTEPIIMRMVMLKVNRGY